MDKLIQLLQTALANNFAWYTETHQNHWDLSGPDFPQYHKFLNEIYADAQENIDNYGERIRQLGAYPMMDPDEVKTNKNVPEPQEQSNDEVTDPVEIFTQLASWNETIITQLQDTYDAANGVRAYGIQNFLADRIDSHMQFQWMIHAILGQTP
jgi:starvation-inducible DNA-binding protein